MWNRSPTMPLFLDKVNRRCRPLINVRPPLRSSRRTHPHRPLDGRNHDQDGRPLAILFAKVGHPVCPDCRIDARSFHLAASSTTPEPLRDARAMILFPITAPAPKQDQAFLQSLLLRGFTRVRCGAEILDLHEIQAFPKPGQTMFM